MNPVCYSCGQDREDLLVKREKELLEWWCEPCIVYHMAMNMFSTSWSRRIFSQFVMRDFRKLHWSKRLAHWIGASKTMKAYADKLKTDDCDFRYRVAMWHVARYKIMYDPCKNDRQVYVNGAQILKIVVDGKTIVATNLFQKV